MKLTSRGQAAAIVAAALVVILLAVLIWRLGPGRPADDGEIAVAQVYRDTEQLLDSEGLDELPQAQQDELRAELQDQLDALQPSERALEAADEQGAPVGVSQADYVPGLPGAFLSSARMIVHGPSAPPEQQVVLSSIAAHRAATALELGADAKKVERAVPELTGDDALPAAQDGQDPAPMAAGESPHPELALARQLGQARDADRTWSHLPSHQRPDSSAWAEALLPVQDSDWLAALEQRHPSVIDGSPGMPEGFRDDPDAARDRLIDQLQDTALAQIAAASDPQAQELDSPSPDPGTAVLMRLAIARAQDDQPVGPLPGLQD